MGLFFRKSMVDDFKLLNYMAIVNFFGISLIRELGIFLINVKIVL